ncbi:MAG: hypothetical protein RIG62_14995 [Cyclobacteriaceae bacterium]
MKQLLIDLILLVLSPEIEEGEDTSTIYSTGEIVCFYIMITFVITITVLTM